MITVNLLFLNKKLPKGLTERISIIDSVDLGSLRIQMMGESRLSLEDKGGEIDPMSDGTVGGICMSSNEFELFRSKNKRVFS